MNKEKPPTAKPARKKSSDESPVRTKKHLDDILDEALEETFPASDPVQLAKKEVKSK